jgi:cobalt-zinc-cadmium efflux system protein
MMMAVINQQKNHSHPHDPHHHDHGDVFHSHAPAGKMRLAFLLTLVVLVAEVLGGMFSHSLALWSDAGHVLTDLAAIGLSWYALVQSQRPANEKMTFGYHRSGILAALVNGVTLLAITCVILVEAYHRFGHTTHIDSRWMFASAAVGLIVNLYLGLGMRHVENINVRSAVLHMMGDAAASAAVIVGGLLILFAGWTVVDPILSVLIALLIAFGAWQIVRQTVSILMEAAPKGIDLQKVVSEIYEVPGVENVHDVHIWCITSGRNALSCHVVLRGETTIQQSQTILRAVEHRLMHVGITHVTLQFEDESHAHEDSLFCQEQAHVH